MAQIAIIGTGYVGLTTGACLASLGHHVICADIDEGKVNRLRNGEIPFVEQGLAELVRGGINSSSLEFVLGAADAARVCEFVFICVPTPEGQSGEPDLTYVETAAKEIAPVLIQNSVVINKSTVPVGSALFVEKVMCRSDVHVVSNPEFLREGSAVHDFLNPDRIIIGCNNQETAMRVASLYKSLDAPVLITDAVSAETIKYAANAFLAMKISFVNALAAISEGLNADIRDVLQGIGYDKRIGHEFLRPGPGWGGSCFPKDTLALLAIAKKVGYNFELLESVVSQNTEQFDRITAKIFESTPPKGTVAIWGLTFKALTDDLRNSPALEIVKRLLKSGFKVQGYDPTVKSKLDGYPHLAICGSELETCDGADSLAVLTEWENFRWVDPEEVATRLNRKEVIDARNILDKSIWRASGFRYQGVGR